jgi:hypothetical protein
MDGLGGLPVDSNAAPEDASRPELNPANPSPKTFMDTVKALHAPFVNHEQSHWPPVAPGNPSLPVGATLSGSIQTGPSGSIPAGPGSAQAPQSYPSLPSMAAQYPQRPQIQQPQPQPQQQSSLEAAKRLTDDMRPPQISNIYPQVQPPPSWNQGTGNEQPKSWVPPGAADWNQGNHMPVSRFFAQTRSTNH